jgi:hypothetical protein
MLLIAKDFRRRAKVAILYLIAVEHRYLFLTTGLNDSI